MSQEELERLKVLHSEANSGEWQTTDTEEGRTVSSTGFPDNQDDTIATTLDKADAEFIAAIYNSFPSLLAEIDARQQQWEDMITAGKRVAREDGALKKEGLERRSDLYAALTTSHDWLQEETALLNRESQELTEDVKRKDEEITRQQELNTRIEEMLVDAEQDLEEAERKLNLVKDLYLIRFAETIDGNSITEEEEEFLSRIYDALNPEEEEQDISF